MWTTTTTGEQVSVCLSIRLVLNTRLKNVGKQAYGGNPPKTLKPSYNEILEHWSVTDRETARTAVFCRTTAWPVDTTLVNVQDRRQYVAGGGIGQE